MEKITDEIAADQLLNKKRVEEMNNTENHMSK